MPELKRLAILGVKAEIAALQTKLQLLEQEQEVSKPHWTQTSDGKKKMALIQQKRWAKNKKAPATK